MKTINPIFRRPVQVEYIRETCKVMSSRILWIRADAYPWLEFTFVQMLELWPVIKVKIKSAITVRKLRKNRSAPTVLVGGFKQEELSLSFVDDSTHNPPIQHMHSSLYPSLYLKFVPLPRKIWSPMLNSKQALKIPTHINILHIKRVIKIKIKN